MSGCDPVRRGSSSEEVSAESPESSSLSNSCMTLVPMTTNTTMMAHSMLRAVTVASSFGPKICTASATEKSAILEHVGKA